ncbi:hypothetical protein [Ruegeria sp. Ofav3-42]|uniref:hypothetical protein n=1 Tax=Ruegeria sp. Ofav3-42 TaxID=2917759 RepID=UPI001EF70B47|nr:hypothetical protein [Ruegeria sp. Ofav3-42]MCG7520836.1 hypothetical protein [Ruegeria sp. Ofav3-42]
MKRITVVVGEGLMTPANHVHMLLGKCGHLNTYRAATWKKGGDSYAVSSGMWTDVQIAGVTNSAILAQLVDDGRVPDDVDLAQAAMAQTSFVFVEPAFNDAGDPLPLPAPSPDKITAYVGDDPTALLAQIGATVSEPII